MTENTLFYQSAEFDIGKVTVIANDSAVVGLKIGFDICDSDNKITNIAIKQLDEYLGGRRFAFELPLLLQNSGFFRTVWENLLKVPYGETLSYKELAVRSGSPRGARAVGMACNKNKIPLIIPCHRVIASSGGVCGFAYGNEMKLWLLAHEKTHKKQI